MQGFRKRFYQGQFGGRRMAVRMIALAENRAVVLDLESGQSQSQNIGQMHREVAIRFSCKTLYIY